MAKDISGREENSYFSGQNIILYAAAIKQIKKGSNHLRPLFEAFTNAWESFLPEAKNKKITITISVFNEELETGVPPKYRFNKITVEDNGVGFNQNNYERFERLNDDTKGNSNKGTGRIQYIHYFKNTAFDSFYKENEKFYERTFSLSGSSEFLRNNAILFYKTTIKSSEQKTGSIIVFTEPLNENTQHFYENITVESLKNEFLRNYMLLFCNSKESMPKIEIKQEVNNIIIDSTTITSSDIPDSDKSFNIQIPYKEKKDGVIRQISQKEDITVQTFKIEADQLTTNQLVLSAKGESAESNIKLDCLTDKDVIDEKRYMFILKAKYFDRIISNDRGKIELLSEEDVKKKEESFFDEPFLLLEDIQNETNAKIITEFPEIQAKQNEMVQNIQELQKMFLLNPDAIKAFKFTSADDDKSILTKVYKYDVEVIAKRDAMLKKQIEALQKLDTSDSDYDDKLSNQVDDLVKFIPQQNRTALTQYVARRQLVLKQFDLILKRRLDCQTEGSRNKDEKLLHNLIFKQHSTDTNNSSLWLLNEEFIYFSGISESRLCDVEINGEKVFRQEITEKELEYLHEFGEERENLRPDILLFPSEGKALIIEFKAPDVNPSKYVTQIQNYASLLLNYCEPNFPLKSFYGYLVGENIEPKDIRHHNPHFINSPNFDYLYLPSQPVVNDSDGPDGEIYMEVLKYSTLLKRAELRNKIYKEKLGVEAL